MDIFKLKFGKNNEPEDEGQLAESLQFLEGVLKEEDPDFMKSVGNISIEDAEVYESLVDESMLVADDNFDAAKPKIQILQFPFFAKIFKPFMIHKHLKEVISFWLIVAGISYGFVKMYKSNFWSANQQLLLRSYADWGLKVQDYDMLGPVEPFYDNVRFLKNSMSLVRLTANLKPSENSSENPMISFEIVLQGVSIEPVVEIKDREAEFRDLVLRVAEEFSYDELENPQGKQSLSEAILAKVNANLTNGQVRRVYYKNFVLKP